MKLSEIYSKKTAPGTAPGKTPVISIEIFPPKADSLADFDIKKAALFEELKILNETFKPGLVSATYGAGGGTREKSNLLIKELVENFNFDIVMPHFTCVCSERKFIENYLLEIKNLGIENILALKGDEPKDITVCHRDFQYAHELVEFIKTRSELEIAVAGYPEKHILAKTLEDDIKNLKIKVEKGANAIFTQFFFENEKFYNYLEILEKNKIDLPVIAGLLPVISFQGLTRMTELSGIKLSKKVLNHFEKWQNSKTDTIKAGIDWTSAQTEDLIKQGAAAGIHYYSLNKSHSTAEILKNCVSCKKPRTP